MAWIGKTKEEIREYDRQYRQKNKDRINQQDKDYYNRANGKDIPSPLTPVDQTKFFDVIGPIPGVGEKAIYFLRNDNGAYYVGSTAGPKMRMAQHRNSVGRTGEMVIVRICPDHEVVYWESKLIVELTEQGVILENIVAPCLLKM